mmetsp:Transcript_90693/g.265437  ORF Transcript_90693/g.265437 Transcript_90693/m.265437 type:complete len:309 (-) Transcript_90693:139-1065(-)
MCDQHVQEGLQGLSFRDCFQKGADAIPTMAHRVSRSSRGTAVIQPQIMQTSVGALTRFENGNQLSFSMKARFGIWVPSFVAPRALVCMAPEDEVLAPRAQPIAQGTLPKISPHARQRLGVFRWPCPREVHSDLHVVSERLRVCHFHYLDTVARLAQARQVPLQCDAPAGDQKQVGERASPSEGQELFTKARASATRRQQDVEAPAGVQNSLGRCRAPSQDLDRALCHTARAAASSSGRGQHLVSVRGDDATMLGTARAKRHAAKSEAALHVQQLYLVREALGNVLHRLQNPLRTTACRTHARRGKHIT